jgi:hypothetical protein
MIITFSVSNFRSIKETQTLSFLPETKLGKDKHNENLIPDTANPYGIKLLKSICIYGANASGKSNLLIAFDELKKLMTVKLTKKAEITAYQPFLLDKVSSDAPAIFELDFIAHNKIRYTYKVELKANEILFESLHFYPYENKKRISKVKIFEKIKSEISFAEAFKGRKNFDFYPNQTFVSFASDTPIPELTAIYTYIESLKTEYNKFHNKNEIDIQKSVLKANEFIQKNLMVLAKEADIGIHELQIRKTDNSAQKAYSIGYAEKLITEQYKDNEEKQTQALERFKEEVSLFFDQKVEFLRPIYNDDNVESYHAPFGLDLESKGTLAMLAISTPLLQALEVGGFIAVDEIEQNLHPKLHQLLIGLFNTNQNNPNNAQIVFTTHDVSLINKDFFRFDQIAFAEKNKKGESIIYRLSDFNGISKVEALEKWYMLGMFGATPIIAEKGNIFLHFPTPTPNA